MLAETMSITETAEININGNIIDQNDEIDQNSLDQVKTNQMFIFDKTNKRKDFQSRDLSFPDSYCRLNVRSEINLISCEAIPSEWNCSNGNNQHSYCNRLCPFEEQFHAFELSMELGVLNNIPSEAIKCKCRSHQPCQWEQKGKTCFTKSNFRNYYFQNQISRVDPEQNGSISVDQFEQKLENQLIDSINSNSNLAENILNSIDIPLGGVQSETITLSAGDLVNSKNIETENEFSQLLRDIQVTNTGHMVFNFNYINKL